MTVTSGLGVGQSRRILANSSTALTLDRPWDVVPDGSSGFRIDDFQTVTLINAGAGDDKVTATVGPDDGILAVDGQEGNDSIDASTSTRDVALFGGDGNDTLKGGTAGDILFGDRGQVDYRDSSGGLITRLGTPSRVIEGRVASAGATSLTSLSSDFPHGGLDNLVGLLVYITSGRGAGQSRRIVGNDANDLTVDRAWDVQPNATSFYRVTRIGIETQALQGPVATAGADSLTSMGVQFPTGDRSLAGSTIFINQGAGFGQSRQIVRNTAGELFVDRPWTVLPDNTSEFRILIVPQDQDDGLRRDPTLILSIDPDFGGNDSIVAGPGNDRVFGGVGNDTIDAGTGDDIVIGDNGTLEYKRVEVPSTGVGDPVPAVLTTIETTYNQSGGNDVISGGDGSDVILAGAGADTVFGGANQPSNPLDGGDLIIGDFGSVSFFNTRLVRVETTPDALHGGNDILSGQEGPDSILGGDGNDSLTGGAGADTLIGDQGLLECERGVLEDIMTLADGEGGNDVLSGGDDRDLLVGGAGPTRSQAARATTS